MKERIMSIPDPLINQWGERISTIEQWNKEQRPLLLGLFKEHVYGIESVNNPESLSFKLDVKDGMMEGKAVRKKVSITYEGSGGKGTINLVLFIPKDAVKPVPVFLLINNRQFVNIDPERITKSPFWPAEIMIERGYGAAAFAVDDVDPDKYDGFKDGVHGIFDSQDVPRQSNAWGTISAWAWGASRVMDYFETDQDIDVKRIALVGHSRAGKTSLWAGAQDERFAMVVGNNSGSTGAAVSRGKIGETIQNINDAFPHWFCENYKKFNSREYELPVDQHMLLALIAPRLLYITSASEDIWADPESEFLSCTLAESVFNLFGLKGLRIGEIPGANSPVIGEHMAYHLREGGHNLTEYDWNCFMDYSDKYMK
jgi:hypothetical protein